MKKIRIGKDINLRWEILTNGEKVSLENRDLKLELVTPLRTRIDLPFVTSFNIIEAKYRGVDQKQHGIYRITLWENYGKDEQTAVDICEAFQLVSCTCNENDGTSGIDIDTFVDLQTSQIEVLSKNGLYSKSVKYIETLTQEEYDAIEVKDEQTLYIVV